ncbi:HNH endonuclease [Zhongshania sp. BJYM1]|uniref:HNH endonuclease n=1 Tax=Zhongshania aquatica TaxID=2965069 RepID=UPI0022B2B290|nr:HNH endonuclease [Marortus sp. BJYM1]
MTVRISLSKKIRFEVFKRDSFTCQYCGNKAPDVLLEVDHIKPVAQGGTNDILNLITSCFDCNRGKSDRELSDNTVIEKQRDQLEALQERKEQIEMMFEWQKALMDLDDEVVSQLSDFWSEVIPGYSLNENGRKSLIKLNRKYEIDEIMCAMKIASEQYLVVEDDSPTSESVEMAWRKLSGICANKRLEKDNPNLSRLYYIRGILRNRMSYCNEGVALQLLKEALELNASLESLEEHAKSSKNWTQWRQGIESFIGSQLEEDDSATNEG